jgi:hypothetical protein
MAKVAHKTLLIRISPAVCLMVVSLTVCACQASQSTVAPAAPSATARLTVSRSSYSFPMTRVGENLMSPTFDLSASGNGSLTVATVTTSNAAEFVLINQGSCIGTLLTGGASSLCQIAVKFQPAAPGVRSSQITVGSSDGTSLTIPVSGSAAAAATDQTSGGVDPAAGGGGGSGGGSDGGQASSPSGGGSFPQAPCVPNQTGRVSLTIINTTTFGIQLTITAATQSTVTLNPGGVQVVPAAAGNYTFTGAVSGQPNAVFTPSLWALSTGCDYLLQVVNSPGPQSVVMAPK